jgi:hypothetical protein
VVASGVADIVEIVMLAASANAFLARRGGRIGPGFETSEDVLERHHPCVDEHQSWIVVRHQGRRGHDLMALPPEIFEERAADVVR